MITCVCIDHICYVLSKFKIKSLRGKEIINMNTLLYVYKFLFVAEREKLKGGQQPTTKTNKQANTAEMSRADSEQANVIINNTSELTCLKFTSRSKINYQKVFYTQNNHSELNLYRLNNLFVGNHWKHDKCNQKGHFSISPIFLGRPILK